MFEIGFLVLIGVYLQIVIVRDKKYRKQQLAIAKKKQYRKSIQYVPIDKSKVLYLNDYRRKRFAGNAG